MLDSFRRFGTSGPGKYLLAVLMGLLIVSFGIWGIADVFRGYGQGALAKVGRTEINANEFNFELQREVQREMQLAARYGQRLSAEQARLFGGQQVLSRLISQAAIDQHAQELKLGLSDTAIAEMIRSDPNFQNTDGSFNKAAFDGLLRQVGVNEGGFIARQRAESIRHQLTDTMITGVAPPEPMIEAMNRFQNETRAAASFVLGPDQIAPLAEPDETKLKAYYEEQKRQFVTPEQRRIALTTLSADSVKKAIEIPDADIKADYEANKASFEVAEKRHLQQLSFPSRAAAEDAEKQIKAGKDFMEVAKVLGRKDSEVDLGTLTERQMLDPKIAAAAFKLAKGKPSGVIEGEFAFAILRATEVEPGKTRSFEEVKTEIRDKLAGSKAQAKLDEVYKAVEDARAGGQPLKDIAAKFSLAFQDITSIDRRGNGPDGKPVPAFPGEAEVLNAAFGGAGVGVENEALQLPDGGFAWFDVVAVTPEKQKSLEEVKDEVKTRYSENERRQALQEKARLIVERIGKGETIEALAKESAGKLVMVPPFKRSARPTELPPAAVAFAFSLPLNGAGSAEAADGKGRVIFKVTDITLPAKASGVTQQQLKSEITRQLQNDVVSQYVAALQGRYGLTINQKEIQRVMTGATGEDQ